MLACPNIDFDAMRQEYFRDAGAPYNDVMYWSKPSDWKSQTTTPNHSTNYIMFFMNLQDGPVVVDIPAAQEVAPAHGTKLTFVEPGRSVRLDERGYAWFAMYGPVVPPPSRIGR